MPYSVSTDKQHLDITLIHRYISNSYWAKGVPLSVVEKSIQQPEFLMQKRELKPMSNFKGLSSEERGYSLLTDAPQHKSTVIDWYFDAWGKRDPNNTLESYTEKLESFLQDGSIPAHVVICDGERLVATAHIRKHEIPSYVDYEMWLGGVYVDSEYRGQGVAKTVVNNVIEEAKYRGIKALYLQTEDLSGGLYAELGWKKLHQINNKGSEVIVMVKEL